MSTIINRLEKKLYINKPYDGANGQYNYGRVNVYDSIRILGKLKSNMQNEGTDLYTLVDSKNDSNITNYPSGLLRGRDSKIEFKSVITYYTGTETDDGVYYSAAWALYMYDMASNESATNTLDNLNNSGDNVRNSIGTGNSFDNPGGGHMIGSRYWGYQTEWGSLSVDAANSVDDVAPNANSCDKYNPYASNWCGPGLTTALGGGTPTIEKFHLGSGKSSTSTNFATNDFMDGLVGNDINSYKDNIIMITRTAADEKEWGLFGHGWKGLGSGYENDERDRIYAKSKVKKSQLYEIWKDHSGQVKLFNFNHVYNHIFI